MTWARCGRRGCRCTIPDESPTAPHGYAGATIHVDAVVVRCLCGVEVATRHGMVTALGLLTLHRARAQYAARTLAAADAGNAVLGLVVGLALSCAFWAVLLGAYVLGQHR